MMEDVWLKAGQEFTSNHRKVFLFSLSSFSFEGTIKRVKNKKINSWKCCLERAPATTTNPAIDLTYLLLLLLDTTNCVAV